MDQHYVSISGLSFGFTTANSTHFGDGAAKDIKAIINLSGYCHNIEIKSCDFKHVNAGIAVENTAEPALTVNNITISDNHLRHVSDQPITFSNGSGKYMEDIYILRNKVYENGFRQLNRWYSAIPAITAYLKTGVVAGNFIDYSWGAGVYLFWGKGTSDATRTIPLIRGFVYHNRAENTLLGTSDWGGIEHWQGGPAYYYNNYSKNAHGWQGSMKNDPWNPWAFPFYFDGSFKLYAFNNIAVSPFNSTTDPSKRNRAGYQMVLGTFAMLANNTSHNFYYGIISQANDGGVPAYNAYLGNILNKTSNSYFNQSKTPTSLVPFDSYAKNIFAGTANKYWEYQGGTATSFKSFKDKLEELNAQSSQLGWEATHEVIPNAESNNFTPSTTGEAIDRGVKIFAPFALNAVVGEWHFYKHNADSSLIMGENFYMTDEYEHRGMYYDIPKNNLKVHSVTYADFVEGELEDWTEGALQFDGESLYCEISNSSEQQSLVTNDLDMETNNFIIEVYLKTTESHINSTIVSKYGSGTNGYRLGIDAGGNPFLEIISGGTAEIGQSGSTPVNDGQWHHILAEVTRTSGINIYIDGTLSNGTATGSMPAENVSLENSADFLIGKDVDGNYFNGTIDFVRVSKGDLADANTTIDELYQWQFDGPFLYDFAGKEPIGKRDAGALEAGEKLCDLNITPSAVEFEVEGGTKQITVTGSTDIELLDVAGEFITAGLNEEIIELTVPANPSIESRQGLIEVFGCNETVQIPISQKGQPSGIDEQFNVLNVYPNPVTDILKIEHNYPNHIEMKIFDLSGHQLYINPEVSNSDRIHLSKFEKGMYLLQTEINGEVNIIKIVVN
jgi:hypothetical protein